MFFTTYLLDRESAYILAGDETIVSKSGQSTYGLSRCLVMVKRYRFSVLWAVISECQGAALLPDDYGANRARGHL